jgi:glycosyltransferase involved in cell wall biosynthesis
MSCPAVTVLMCTYNDESTIADSLQSALAQTAAPSRYRILVVDDGSTDATRWILDAYRERIQIVQLQGNRGLAAACNEGLRHIETTFFVRLDTDDRFDPNLVTSLLTCREASGASIIFTDRYEQIPNGRQTVRHLTEPPNLDELVAAGSLLPTQLVRDLGGYRPLFWEELDLYIRLFQSGRCRIAHIPRPLYVYRVQGPDQMTTDAEATRAGWDELRRLWPPGAFVRALPQAHVMGPR